MYPIFEAEYPILVVVVNMSMLVGEVKLKKTFSVDKTKTIIVEHAKISWKYPFVDFSETSLLSLS